MSETDALLSVRNLEKHYPITEGLLRRQVGRVRAVDDVSFDVRRGEAFGLVGESGCGKTTTALTALRLEEPTDGEILFDGDDVRGFDEGELRRYRRRAQLVLQDPDSTFNPRLTVGEAVAEPLRIHGMQDPDRRRRVVEDTIERVGLSADAVGRYPHEFSGGEKQRLALARALVLNPDLIVADEPVSALDGRTKANVLALMAELQEEFDLAILLISHDVDLVRRFCDRVAVMYLGNIVETGTVDAVLDDPHHPYTRELLSSVPPLRPGKSRGSRLEPPTDEPPDASDIPSGCRFHPRCSAVIPPEEVELPREEWVGAVTLRFRLENEWADIDALRSSLAHESGEEPSLAAAADRVRDALDLPAEFSDPTVESAVTEAIDAIRSGDLDTARERIVQTVSSVCQRESPSLTDDHASRPVACHRYDSNLPGDPLAGIEVSPTRD